MKAFLRVFLAFIFILCAIGFVFAFEFYAKEKIDSVEVIVAKEEIDFKEIITEDNIEIINVRRTHAIENAIPVTAYKSLIGKYASVKIAKGTQLYVELIDTYNLVPDSTKGEFVAPLPKDWIFAVPGSMRRTFVADIYVIGTKEQLIYQNLQQDSDEQGKSTSAAPQTIIPAAEPILENVRVASVKDNNNQEVVQSEETNQATGQVANLEIIANDEMFETMRSYTQQGYRLYIVYKFDRSAGDSQEGEQGNE